MAEVHPSDPWGALPIVARSIRDVADAIAPKVSSDALLLLTGERGVGKNFAARVIHAASMRGERSFIKVDCATPLARLESQLFGREKDPASCRRRMLSGFEYANKGIIFLDELHALPRGLASRLLDVLRSRRVPRSGSQLSFAVDVAVLAAATAPPDHATDVEFWAELRCLNMVETRIASLRDRKDEIPVLASWFLCDFNQRYQRTVELAPETLALFMEYTWPENVHELRSVIRRLVVTGDTGRVHGEITVAIANDRAASIPR